MNTTSRMSAPRPPMIQRRRAPAVLMTCAVLAVIFIPCLLTSGYYAFTLRYSPAAPQSRIPRAGQALSRSTRPGPDSPGRTAQPRARGGAGPADRGGRGGGGRGEGERGRARAARPPATDIQEADSSLG